MISCLGPIPRCHSSRPWPENDAYALPCGSKHEPMDLIAPRATSQASPKVHRIHAGSAIACSYFALDRHHANWLLANCFKNYPAVRPCTGIWKTLRADRYDLGDTFA